MAMTSNVGLNSQIAKFHQRYGKAIGSGAVTRQMHHVVKERIIQEAAQKAQIPLLGPSKKTILGAPKHYGGVYSQVVENLDIKNTCDRLERIFRKKYTNASLNLRRAIDELEVGSSSQSRIRAELLRRFGLGSSANLPAIASATGATGAAAAAAGVKGTTATAGGIKNGGGKIAGLLPSPETVSTAQNPIKPKGFFGKALDFLKKNKKTAIIATAVTALIAGGVYLYNRNRVSEKALPTSDSSPIQELANKPIGGQMTADGPYSVAKGDNIWNIAKAHLDKMNENNKDYKGATDVEIYHHVEKLMELNGLNYENDSYKVIIQPDQVLKLK